MLLGLAAVVGLAETEADEESRAALTGWRAIKRGSSEMDNPLGLMSFEEEVGSIVVGLL